MTVWSTITHDSTTKALRDRLAALTGGPPLAVNGLWGSSAPILAATLAKQLGRPLLYITAHLEQADHARDDIETVLGRAAEILTAWETLPGEGSGAGEIGEARARLCEILQNQTTGISNPQAKRTASESVTPKSDPLLPRSEDSSSSDAAQAITIVAPIQALLQPVPSPKTLEANSLVLTVGEVRRPEEIAQWLSDRGFERLDQVEQPGDFALRGGIFDIYASSDIDPVRIEFFGDQIESIRQFEVGTQRSTRTLSSTRITRSPDASRLTVKDTTSFLDYLPPETVVILNEPVDTAEIARTILQRLGNPIGHYSFEAVVRKLEPFAQLYLSRFPLAAIATQDSFHVSCDPLPSFEAKTSDAVQQLINMSREHPVVVCCDNQGEQERLLELIAQVQSQNEAMTQTAPQIETIIGLIHEGFRWKTAAKTEVQKSPTSNFDSISIIPHHDLFRRYTLHRPMRKVTASRPIESFLDLKDGDYVVHILHGIAKFEGMKTIAKAESGRSEEFLTLRFAGDATMHVPVSQIDLVQKYVGAKAVRPTLSALGGSRWQATKARVEEAITDLAGDMLRIQADRDSKPGIAYPQDTHWQREFENAFLYSETPDQTTALKDIKADQTRTRPMDRLLCGDVGFGKTELAMRAAFKVAEFGKQTAILVPTTVLAEQHYRTFTERMGEFPFVVDALHRFRTTHQQKETIKAASKGQIDVLIGTHRLLSKDVKFADLGLVIVDEEQRFGVEHKERLKHLRSTVDVLTLTATPIPRTLHLSMIGLRDISCLSTPPLDRRSIATRVSSWDDEMIREALVRELNREGQAYFVHNRVQSIQAVADRIGVLVPDARILVGHGQMPGEQLEDVMLRFVRHEADILVCTTIIEAGLDIPNANTIFIDRAELFGLADLHQLRGRVGRYKHRAYCYLLLSPDKPLNSVAAKRLKAIEEYSELGAGFRIAMQDLEIRGAGNILGTEQSGHIAAVGYELYCQLLEKTVKEMRGEAPQERIAVHLELGITAYIPKSYIAADRQRMECYRRLSQCRLPEDVEQLSRDLIDAYGKYPENVDTLLTLADIRVRAAQFGIRAIQKKEPDVIFRFDGEVRRLEPIFRNTKGQVSLPDGHTLYWRPPENYFHGNSLLPLLRKILRGERDESASVNTPARTSPAIENSRAVRASSRRQVKRQ